jgi:cell division protein FtsB
MDTLIDNLRAMLPYWWVLVVGGAMALSDLYRWHWPDGKEIRMPHWLRLTISLLALVLAQFLAYRDEGKNLARVVEEKREFSIRNDALRGEVNNAHGENTTLSTENENLKAQIPNQDSLKVRARKAADEYEQFWKTVPKSPVCTQTNTMTPEEQRKAIEPCTIWWNKRTVDYQRLLGPRIMEIVEEFKAKGVDVMNIENCASNGFCGIPLSVQLRAFSLRLDAQDHLKH